MKEKATRSKDEIAGEAPSARPGIPAGRRETVSPGHVSGHGAPPLSSMGTSSMSEETRLKLDQLSTRLQSLQEMILLSDAQREISETRMRLSLLPTEVGKLRSRGYVFRNFLEHEIGALSDQWKELQKHILPEIGLQVQELQRAADEAEKALHLALNGNLVLVANAESSINMLESKARAAHSAVEATYEPLKERVARIGRQIEDVRWMLDQVDEASFQLLAGESVAAACKARLIENGEEGAEGVLYLTDRHLLFERKEEVVTRKVLFIPTAKQKVQELVFAVPVDEVEEVKASDERKFLGHKEILELIFAPGVAAGSVTLRLLNTDNETWVRVIGQVQSGEINKERIRPGDASVVESTRTVPTRCTACGARLMVTVAPGVRRVTCEYCGSLIDLED